MTRKRGKHKKIIRSDFGKLLQEYRLRGRNPENNGRLTQERFAELLDEIAGLPGYSFINVSR